MTDGPLELVREGGVIRGRDPESGETVPIDLGAVRTEALVGVYDHVVTPDDDLAAVARELSVDASVWVGPGTHEVDSDGRVAVPVTADGVTVDGPGVIRLADGAAGATASGDRAVVGLGAPGEDSPDGVALGNVTVDANRDGNDGTVHAVGVFGATDYAIENVTARGGTGAGVASAGGPPGDGRVENCTVESCAGGGVRLDGRVRGVGNTVRDVGGDGVVAGDGQTWRDTVVENVDGTALAVRDAADVTLAGTEVRVGPRGPSTGVAFTDGAAGGVASDTTYLGAAATGADRSGDDRFLAAGDQRGCRVDGAEVRGATAPAQVADGAPFTLSGVTVLDGEADALAVVAGDGDDAPGDTDEGDGPSGVVVRDCRVLDTDGAAVTLAEGTAGVTVEGTHVEGCEAGVRLAGDDHVVRDCEFAGLSGPGVVGTPDDRGPLVADNRMVGCGDAAIDLAVADHVTVAGNRTRDTTGQAVHLTVADGAGHGGVVVRDHQSVDDSQGIQLAETDGRFDHVVLQGNHVESTLVGQRYDLSLSGVLFRNGVHRVSGTAPSQADYTENDAGRRVVRTDEAGEWLVQADGSLVQVV